MDFLYEYFLHACMHTYTEERVGGSTKMCMCVCIYMSVRGGIESYQHKGVRVEREGEMGLCSCRICR